jgi:hypothetical protein
MKKRERDESLVSTKLAEAQGYRATFHEAVERARASGTVDQAFTERIDAQFEALEKQIQATTDENILENLCDRAEELERLRAYVLPEQEILLQAQTCLIDMRDWGVPRLTLRSIETDLVVPMHKKDEVPTKRAALHKLFDFYDFWESQVTSYDDWIEERSKRFGVLLALALGGSIVGVVLGSGLAAFLAGGLAGSLVSVLSRLPPMLGWGGWAALPVRMYSRIGLGIGGTIAGGGLMAAGLITIGKTPAEFADIISTSHRATTSEGLYMVAIGILLGFSERLLSSMAGAFVRSSVSQEAPQRVPVKEEEA